MEFLISNYNLVFPIGGISAFQLQFSISNYNLVFPIGGISAFQL